MILYTVDPSAWSVSTTLALIGIIVSLLGAVATGLLALLALRQTRAVTRLEREARDRADRLAAASAIEVYLAGWKPLWDVYGRRNIDEDAVWALRSSAAGISTQAQNVASWIVAELDRTVDLFVKDHHALDTQTAEGMMTITVRSALKAIRHRVIAWVATGAMNQDALYRPPPPLPPFETTD